MSQLPSDLPQLPKWPFFCADVVLLGAAAAVAWGGSGPLSAGAMITVMVCVALASILCAIPFLTDYARSQDQAYDERQRSLEALAKSVANSAEQVGIAVQGLGRLDEQLQRHIRHIDQVPQQVSERLGELQQNFSSTPDGRVAELERELAALKATGRDRLENVEAQIIRTTAELARLEQSIARHADAARSHASSFELVASEAASRISSGVDQSLARSSETLAASLLTARTGLDALLVETQARLVAQLDARLSEARSAIDASANAACVRLDEFSARLDARIEAASATLTVAARDLAASATAAAATAAATVATTSSTDISENAENGSFSSAEPVPASTIILPETASTLETAQIAVIAPKLPAPAASEEVQPAAVVEASVAAPTTSTAAISSVASPAAPAQTVRPPRRKPEPVPAAQVMDLFNEDFSLEDHQTREPLLSRSVSADGATRINVTAYIGIGNKLYIRGDGPGLSWERGQPLVFVSIGKWRWETLEAESSFRFRLYKNDSAECSSLGEQHVDVGQQVEVSANF